MRYRLFVGLALVAINVIRADEPQQAETDKPLLAKKLVELEKLQVEVDRLRQKTGQSPQQVLVRVRAIEIQSEKLRLAGKSHPLQHAPQRNEVAGLRQSPAATVGYHVIDHESLDDALQELDASVKQGFAKILADASVLTVAGRHERMLSGSEFPVPMPQSVGSRKNQLRFAGLDLELLSYVNADRQITLDCNFKWSEKDFTHIAKFRDTIVPGIRSRSLCTKIQMSSRETVCLRGLSGGSNPRLPNGDEHAAQETEFACLITSELVQRNDEPDFHR